MRQFLLIATATLCAVCASAYDYPGNGTRIDYLDYTGKIIRSQMLDSNSGGSSAFTVAKLSEDGKYIVSDGWDSNGVHSVRFIPWGTEKYPLEISVENPDVKVSYEIVEGNGAKRAVAKADSTDILCGTAIKFTITVPKDTYPQITMCNEYTWAGYGEDGVPYTYTFNGCGFSELSRRPLFTDNRGALDMGYRKYLKDNFDGNGAFEKDSSDSGVFYYTHTMGNEPQSLVFGSYSPSGEELKQAVLQALASMYCQHGDVMGPNQNNGEPYLSNFYGDALGADFISPLVRLTYGNTDMMAMFGNAKSWVSLVPYENYMSMVAEANTRLDMMDRYQCSEQEKDIARAQLLCLRSHAYLRLMQIYGARWSESTGGSTLCVPLETTFNTENVAPATMKEIADMCAADLEEAMEKLGESDYRRDYLIQPDVNVARMLRMRFAMLCEDWDTARNVAMKVTNAVPLTTNDELLSGFTTAAPSWIWGAWNQGELNGTQNGLYYYSYQCMNACNGTYTGGWGMGTNAISRDLFTSVGENDIRRGLFVMPENLPSPLKSLSQWYEAEFYQVANYGLTYLNDANAENVRSVYSDKAPAGVIYPAFTTDWGQIPVMFGSQVKFYQPGEAFDAAPVVFMRADEALLSLAEAYYHLGQPAEAREVLARLESVRNPGNDALPSAGDDLLEAIRLSRRIELWGEGFSWFDLKRWNQPRVRKEWMAGDTDSGNWFWTNDAVNQTDYNGWRLVIPLLAVENNPLIDISKYGYSSSTGYEAPETESAAVQRIAAPKSGSHLRQTSGRPITDMQKEPVRDR